MLAPAAQPLAAKATNGIMTAAAMRTPPRRMTFVKIIMLMWHPLARAGTSDEPLDHAPQPCG